MSARGWRRIRLGGITASIICVVASNAAYSQVTPILKSGIWQAGLEREFLGVTGRLPPDMNRAAVREFSFYLSSRDHRFRLLVDDEQLRLPRNSIIPVDITFTNMDLLHFQGQVLNGQVRIDLDDALLAEWTHDFTAGTTMSVSLPTVSTIAWTYDLTGTTPAITAMATAVKAAGITGLPRPWTTDNMPPTQITGLPSSPVPATTTQPSDTMSQRAQLEATRAELDRAKAEVDRARSEAAQARADADQARAAGKAAPLSPPPDTAEAERLRLQIATAEAAKADAEAKRAAAQALTSRAEADRAQAQEQINVDERAKAEEAKRVQAQQEAETRRLKAAREQAEADAKGVEP